VHGPQIKSTFVRLSIDHAMHAGKSSGDDRVMSAQRTKNALSRGPPLSLIQHRDLRARSSGGRCSVARRMTGGASTIPRVALAALGAPLVHHSGSTRLAGAQVRDAARGGRAPFGRFVHFALELGDEALAVARA
jgi:hypothetical protein